METFKHKGAKYSVHALTVLQGSITNRLWLDIIDRLCEDLGCASDNYPRMHDVMSQTYVGWMLATDIDGDTGFSAGSPALSTDILADYHSWKDTILADRELQQKWQVAFDAANKDESDPEVDSDVPNGESK